MSLKTNSNHKSTKNQWNYIFFAAKKEIIEKSLGFRDCQETLSKS